MTLRKKASIIMASMSVPSLRKPAIMLLTGGWLAFGAAVSQEYVPQKDEALPRIRYADSTMSVNDRCPVRLGKLNLRIDPVYVNGRPVGFC